MHGSLVIGSVRGIPVRIHWTFLLVLPLLASLFAQNFREAAELAAVPVSDLRLPPWAWGLGVALGLFASVLVHELAHSLYAVRTGLRVRGILLLMIGGISEIVDPPRRPSQEAAMALVGPLVSLLLGAGLLAGAAAVGRPSDGDVGFALRLLGELNVVLGTFNLLPAFPMDGGRVLRAALTPLLGPLRATRTAAGIGKVFALAFGALGILGGSLVLVLVAFFVWMGASAEGAQTALRELLSGHPVRELVRDPIEPLLGHDTLELAALRMRAERRVSLPVQDGDRVRAVLTLDALRSTPPARWALSLVRQAARPTTAVSPDDDTWTALQRMAADGVPELPVVEDGRTVGRITQADILEGVRLHELDAAWGGPEAGPLRRSPV